MKSAGAVGKTQAASSEAIAKAFYQDIMTKGSVAPHTASKYGFSIDNKRAQYQRITGFGGGINASRFASSAPVKATAADDAPEHVMAMVGAIEKSSPDVGAMLLSMVVKNTKNS